MIKKKKKKKRKKKRNKRIKEINLNLYVNKGQLGFINYILFFLK